MPTPAYVILQPKPIASKVQTTITPPLKVLKRIKPATPMAARTVVGVAGLQRNRSILSVPIVVKSTVKATLKQKIALRPKWIRSVSVMNVEYFVNNAPIAPPTGSLGLASVLPNGQPDPSQSLTGKRLIKGDLIPLYYVLQGQRLEGMTAELHAKQRNAIGSPLEIIKSETVLNFV